MIRKRDQKEEMKFELANKKYKLLRWGKVNPRAHLPQFPTPQCPHHSVSRSMPRGQPSIRLIFETRKKEENNIVAIRFLWSDIPFNIVKNTTFYNSMFEVNAIIGSGYKGTSYNDLR
jgi:hypothetical protein